MRKYILILGFIALATSCVKLSDPITEISASYYLSSSGQYQKAFAGEYLRDSIMITVYDQIYHRNVAGLDVEFEVVSGGGSIETHASKTDARGMAGARWKLGLQPGEQVVRAWIVDANGSVDFTILFRASSFQPGTWNTTIGYPDVSLTDMAADTVSGLTLAIGGNILYKQGARYFEWEPLAGATFSQPRRILFGNDRNFYVGTWDGRMFKSTNLGETWAECAKPWADHNYFYYMGITSDNYLWASANGRGLRCSRDGGQSWTTDTAGIQAAEMLNDIFRTSDGDFYFFSLNCHLYRSADDGHTWQQIQVPGYPLKSFVNDADELFLFTQESGLSIRKSADKGETFTIIKSVSPAFSGMMDHTVVNRGQGYYVLIPGYGILQSTDFSQFTTFWLNSSCRDMLVDAAGNIIVTQLQSGMVYYYGVGPK